MKAIIKIDVPDFQIGQEVNIHFKDSMVAKGVVALSQEPCGDAISRQAAIDAIENTKSVKSEDGELYVAKINAEMNIQLLPSVSTEKTGRWITQWNPAHQKEYYYCSECREEYSYDGETGIKMNNYKFCPNCGARMAESEG